MFAQERAAEALLRSSGWKDTIWSPRAHMHEDIRMTRHTDADSSTRVHVKYS